MRKRTTLPPGWSQPSLFESVGTLQILEIPAAGIIVEPEAIAIPLALPIEVKVVVQAPTLIAATPIAVVAAPMAVATAAPPIEARQTAADFWADAQIVHEHSWKTMIASGELLEVTDLAQEAGFKFPVAITANMSMMLDYKMASGESRAGRLWDVLNIAAWHIKRAEKDVDRVIFRVKFNRVSHECMATVGPKGSDDPAPAITLWLQNEYDD